MNEKQCYIRFYEDLHVLYDNRYINLSLFNFTNGEEPCCHLSGSDDWELSYTGPEAGEKFDALLALGHDVTWMTLNGWALHNTDEHYEQTN